MTNPDPLPDQKHNVMFTICVIFMKVLQIYFETVRLVTISNCGKFIFSSPYRLVNLCGFFNTVAEHVAV